MFVTFVNFNKLIFFFVSGVGGSKGAGGSVGGGKGGKTTGSGDNQMLCPKCGSPCEHVATLISSTRYFFQI